MTALRRRMLEDMQLRGFSARTQGCYVAAVRQLAEHFHRSPDLLTEDDLRQYFLHLANEKKVARDGDDRVVRDSVPLRADAPSGGRRSGSCVGSASCLC